MMMICESERELDLICLTVAGVIVGNHGQDIMRSEPKIHSFDSFSVMTGNTSAVTEGQILGNAINTARMLVNLPPNVLYPETFAERVETLGEESGYDVLPILGAVKNDGNALHAARLA